jgi:hypothetical protein
MIALETQTPLAEIIATGIPIQAETLTSEFVGDSLSLLRKRIWCKTL